MSTTNGNTSGNQGGETSTTPAGQSAGAPGAGKESGSLKESLKGELDASSRALLQGFAKGDDDGDGGEKKKEEGERGDAEKAKAAAEAEAAEKARLEEEAAGDGKAKEDEGAEKVPEFDKSKLEPEAAKAWELLEKKAEGQSKAIDRLTAKRHAAEAKAQEAAEELEALKGEVETLRGSVAVAPTVESPFSDVFKVSELEEKAAKAQNALLWCDDNEDGATVPKAPGSTETVEVTAKQVREYKREQEKVIKDADARKKWLEEHGTARADAGKAYPELRKAGSADAKRREELLSDKKRPGLAAWADADLAIGDMLIGEKVRKGLLVAFPKGTKAGEVAKAKGTEAQSAKEAGTSAATGTGKEKGKEEGKKPDATVIAKLQERALNGDKGAQERLMEIRLGS